MELVELYPMDTFAARFNAWILSKRANPGPNPGFPHKIHRHSLIGQTKRPKLYTKIELDELYPMDISNRRFHARIHPKTANQAWEPVFFSENLSWIRPCAGPKRENDTQI